MATMMRPHLGPDVAESEFSAAVASLTQTTESRVAAVKAYLATL